MPTSQRAKPTDLCIQAICGKGKNVVRDICCESGNKDQWNYVGEGRGCYDTVKKYEYVGDNRGAFEREEVVNGSAAWRFSGWVVCLLTFGAIGGAAFAAGRIYAKVSKADQFSCEAQDAAARSAWSSEQIDWCCKESGICPLATSSSNANLLTGVQQAPGQTATASDLAPAAQPTPAPVPSTTPPLVAENTPPPKPVAPLAPAVPQVLPPPAAAAASPNGAAGVAHDKCNYDGVLFAANLVKWDPPVWKYSQESNTCSALRAGSSSWEKLAFATQAECISACAGKEGAAGAGPAQAGP